MLCMIASLVVNHYMVGHKFVFFFKVITVTPANCFMHYTVLNAQG